MEEMWPSGTLCYQPGKLVFSHTGDSIINIRDNISYFLVSVVTMLGQQLCFMLINITSSSPLVRRVRCVSGTWDKASCYTLSRWVKIRNYLTMFKSFLSGSWSRGQVFVNEQQWDNVLHRVSRWRHQSLGSEQSQDSSLLPGWTCKTWSVQEHQSRSCSGGYVH